MGNVTPNAATTYNFTYDDRATLLFIAGGNDHILPPAVQRENFEKGAKHSKPTTPDLQHIVSVETRAIQLSVASGGNLAAASLSEAMRVKRPVAPSSR